jgi:hypothetical protein
VEFVIHYGKKITDKLSLINDPSKLFLYSKLKSDIKLEENLKSERNFKNRQLLTKFRLNDHNLEIELDVAKIFHEIKDIRDPHICASNDRFIKLQTLGKISLSG